MAFKVRVREKKTQIICQNVDENIATGKSYGAKRLLADISFLLIFCNLGVWVSQRATRNDESNFLSSTSRTRNKSSMSIPTKHTHCRQTWIHAV